jgi:hypothetical protein
VIVRLACIVTVLLVASALPATADATRVTPTAILDCRDPIGGFIDPPSDYERFGDQVALVTGRIREQAMQAAPYRDPSAAPFEYFSKTGLLVRTGKGTAEIRIPRSEHGRLGVLWGNTGQHGIASRVFRIGPCPGGVGYIAFPGGFYVNEPHCARLIVRVGDRERTTRVGLGAPCPGQRPPASP